MELCGSWGSRISSCNALYVKENNVLECTMLAWHLRFETIEATNTVHRGMLQHSWHINATSRISQYTVWFVPELYISTVLMGPPFRTDLLPQPSCSRHVLL
jgi:hypothetical protein